MAEKFKPCSVDGCNGNSHSYAKGSKGLCIKHYTRLLRHGDPLGGRTSPGELERFYEETVLSYEGDDCLIWPHTRDKAGYGKMKESGKQVFVSRRVCEDANGAPPTPKHEAAHSCGRGHEGCVTKRHLSWKTRRQNKDDELVHGTRNRGERHGQAKLTEAQVREIRLLRGKEGQRSIGARFGISPMTVSLIHRGKNWFWLQE